MADMLKLLVPKIPGMLYAAGAYSMGWSETSSKWDLRTEVIMNVLRAILDPAKKPTPLGKVQALLGKDPGIQGKMWIAKAPIPKGEDDDTIREALFKAIADLGDGKETYTKPETVAIHGEWTGYRPDAKDKDRLPDISEEEKYKKLMAEPSRTSNTTVLYFHGGAYYLMSVASHRTSVSRLAKESNGRGFSVEYRLAPQAAFPSQLLDALNSYLYLLYPPPSAFHEPVAASDVVFGGDSAGGNLAFALLQLILQLHRTKPAGAALPKVRYNGKEVEVPLPAGVTANSGWFDVTRAMPSLVGNAKYDYLPPANHDQPYSHIPHDDVWPAKPSRGDVFVDLSLITHPLVSPIAAKDWTNSPSLWIQTGEEMLSDEDALLAATAASQGVTVQWEQYEAMPHIFNAILTHTPASKRCWKSWGEFCKQCVEGTVQTSGTWIAAKTWEEQKVDVATLSEIRFEDAVALMEKVKARRMDGFEQEGAVPKPSL